MTQDELVRMVERVLAMREPRCACGHALTRHTRRKLSCYSRRACRCTGWVPQQSGRALPGETRDGPTVGSSASVRADLSRADDCQVTTTGDTTQ